MHNALYSVHYTRFGYGPFQKIVIYFYNICQTRMRSYYGFQQHDDYVNIILLENAVFHIHCYNTIKKK